jgi:mono/diheme cytochrome c family protein
MKKLISAVALLLLFFSIAAFTSGRPPANASAGADTFKAKCAVCHGPDGSGNTPMGQKMKVHDLRSPDVQKQTDEELTTIITNGKPPMPAYGKTLTSADIHQLVAFLRSIATKS